MDSVAESGPGLFPATAIKEIGIHTAEAARRHDELRTGDVGGKVRAHVLACRQGQRPVRVQKSFDLLVLVIERCDLIDPDGLLLVENGVEEVLHRGGGNDGSTACRQARKF